MTGPASLGLFLGEAGRASRRPKATRPPSRAALRLPRIGMPASLAASALGVALGVALLPRPGAAASFESCLAGLRAASLEAGVNAATFDSAMRGVTFNPEIIELSQVQPEFKTPIWDYLAGLVDEERVNDGRAMMARYGQALAAAEQKFGVDKATITAVWGVESDFGRSFGTKPVLQALATLSCEGRRQSYFRSELIAALKIVQRGDIDPSFTGSWAGAFGHTQFMPSTYLRTAVDLDGDGRRDLVSSVPDALGSTAAYLKKSGWVTGGTWGFEVRLPAGYSGPSGRTKKQSMASWAQRGITRIDGRPLGAGPAAGLLLPSGPQGPAFLVTKNFDAIYSYNAADSYALAIAILSDRLRGQHGIVAAWPTDDPGLSRAERREVQALLMRRGYDLGGKADGVIGSKSRAAISDFQAKAGLPPTGRPSASLLAALRRQ